MNIVMMTNTFTPHVGGVARSVSAFTQEYRRRGHRVIVVAPEFGNIPENEIDVIRIPAIQNFNGSDFSVVLPVPKFLTSALEKFEPDIIHSHHPFLIGATALRLAHILELPLVYTSHTMYERYTHYVPGDSQGMKRFVIKLSSSYANMADLVFAPSESVAAVLRERGVTTTIDVVPTGVDIGQYTQGSGPGFKAAMNIPAEAFVIGHLGRLAKEKNLDFLTNVVAEFIAHHPQAHFLLVGKGPMEDDILAIFKRKGIADHLHRVGILDQPLSTSAYRAMDVFVFASTSETQGMVVTEAMAAGVPVIAIDAPGVREVVEDKYNGCLLDNQSIKLFTQALDWVASLSPAARKQLQDAALKTAESFSMTRSADKALDLYESLLKKEFVQRHEEYNAWKGILRLIETEWDILRGVAGAAGAAIGGDKGRDNTPL